MERARRPRSFDCETLPWGKRGHAPALQIRGLRWRFWLFQLESIDSDADMH